MSSVVLVFQHVEALTRVLFIDYSSALPVRLGGQKSLCQFDFLWGDDAGA